MEDAAGEGAAAGDRPAQQGAAPPGEVAGVGQAFGEGHAHSRAQRRRGAGVESRQRAVGGQRDREYGRQGRQGPVHQAAEGGLDAHEQERLVTDGA